MSPEPGVWITPKLVAVFPWQPPLRDRKKTNFRLIIYSHSSTNPENFAKIGSVDVEIGLTKIAKNKKNQQNIARVCSSRVG